MPTGVGQAGVQTGVGLWPTGVGDVPAVGSKKASRAKLEEAFRKLAAEVSERCIEEVCGEYLRHARKTFVYQLLAVSPKVCGDLFDMHRLPVSGPVVDLFAVVAALRQRMHEYFALRREDPEDPMGSGGDSPALERWREEKWMLARLDRQEREKTLIPRDLVREIMVLQSTIVRPALESLQRQFGPEAYDLMAGALADYLRAAGERLEPPADSNGNANGQGDVHGASGADTGDAEPAGHGPGG